MSDIQSLLAQLEEAASTADLSPSARFRLSTQLKGPAHWIPTPKQIMQHYGYMFTEQLVAKIAADLDLVTILVKSGSPLNTGDIASKTGAILLCLGYRILKHLAATHTVTEVGQSTFAANDATKLLASPTGWGNLMFGYSILNKAFQELPKMVKETRCKNLDHTSDTSFHQAYDAKLPFFIFLQQDPETIRYFQNSLAAFESPVSWITAVPLTERLQGTDKDTLLFVDIGGGHGSQCRSFRQATQVPGRVINQDLPQTLASAPAIEGVEMMAQNFFEENKIKGSFFLRNLAFFLRSRDYGGTVGVRTELQSFALDITSKTHQKL